MAAEDTGRKSDDQLLDEFYQVLTNVSTMSRTAFMSMLNPNRDINSECGFPKNNPDAWTYQKLYDREPVAARIIELYPKEMWKRQPTVFESQDTEDVTAFEEAWDSLGIQLRGERSWYKEETGNPVWDYLCRADILAGIGRYAVIFLGFDDGLDPREPLPGFEEVNSAESKVEGDGDKRKWTKPSVNGLYSFTINKEQTAGRKLKYITCFSEPFAQITAWETNWSSPRHQQPTQYLLTLNDPENTSGFGAPTGTLTVHWSRVIHVATDVIASGTDTFGIPRMQQVLNNVLGIQKIDAASPEAFWKGCLNLLSLETPPQAAGGNVKVNKTELRDMMENLGNSTQKWIALANLTAKSIAPTVTDPTPHSQNQIAKICLRMGCPVPVFQGYEIGEQASENNTKDWDDRLTQRENVYGTPRLVVPLVDRLIAAGVLPEPADGYMVEWPDRTAKDTGKEATTALTVTQALSAYVSGGVEALIPPQDYLTRILDWDEADAEAVIDSAADHMQEVKAGEMADQQEKIEAGLAPDPASPPVLDPIKLKEGETLVPHPAAQ